jgi:pullulanase/glycogen debranching enzyme
VSQSVTKENMLMNMLQCGWQWVQCENHTLMALAYGAFVWKIDPFRFDMGDLIDAMTSNANQLGKRYPELSLDEAMVKSLEDYREARNGVSHPPP